MLEATYLIPRRVGRKNFIRRNNVKMTLSLKFVFLYELNHICGATFKKNIFKFYLFYDEQVFSEGIIIITICIAKFKYSVYRNFNVWSIKNGVLSVLFFRINKTYTIENVYLINESIIPNLNYINTRRK